MRENIYKANAYATVNKNYVNNVDKTNSETK